MHGSHAAQARQSARPGSGESRQRAWGNRPLGAPCPVARAFVDLHPPLLGARADFFRILTLGLAQSAKKPTGEDTVCWSFLKFVSVGDDRSRLLMGRPSAPAQREGEMSGGAGSVQDAGGIGGLAGGRPSQKRHLEMLERGQSFGHGKICKHL